MDKVLDFYDCLLVYALFLCMVGFCCLGSYTAYVDIGLLRTLLGIFVLILLVLIPYALERVFD